LFGSRIRRWRLLGWGASFFRHGEVRYVVVGSVLSSTWGQKDLVQTRNEKTRITRICKICSS
jgi:hypothetical protein